LQIEFESEKIKKCFLDLDRLSKQIGKERAKMNGLSREFIIHPGETLKEILEDRIMTQRELAKRTGVTEKHISTIVNGQKPISVSYAKKLEYALGIDAMFWINLQANFDKELADYEEMSNVTEEERVVVSNIKDISKFCFEVGLLDKKDKGPEQVLEYRKLFNISNLSYISQMKQFGAFRLAKEKSINQYVLYSWITLCDLLASKQPLVNPIDTKKLIKMLPMFKSLLFEDIVTVFHELKQSLADCGIKFSIIRHFRGAPVQGMLKKNHDGTITLNMTVRQKFADIFWFTFFHEIGHILHSDIDDMLIDWDALSSYKEQRADKFAENTLIGQDQYQSFTEKDDFTLQSIEDFCKKNEIPPYILIGRLQRDKYLKYSQYDNLKKKYDLSTIEKLVWNS
jgi:HTH-type transcriptional regulator / antitoxin HigA